jgi:hypothetical protein
MIKGITQFFLSLKTAFGFYFILLVIVFIGSLILPSNLAYFSGIDDAPLFRWLADNFNFRIAWWIYAFILMLALFAVSTIFCTVEALLKRMSRINFILKISPQIMHIGVLFIMLGHLLTASTGFKTDMVIYKGKEKPVTRDIKILLDDISVKTDENGYYTDWGAELRWVEKGEKTQERILRPVHPVYFGQFGLYIQSVTLEPEETALIRVCKDPGALWALIGGLLLSAGGLGFIYGRFRV